METDGHELSKLISHFDKMARNTDFALDSLTRMVQVIAHEPSLRQWFSALAQRSGVERRNEIFSMTERMRAEGKDEDLVAAFHLLADTRVFDTACLALGKYDKEHRLAVSASAPLEFSMPATATNEPRDTSVEARDRWLPLLVTSLLINLGSAFMFPRFVTDAFSWPAFLVCLPPIGWAGVLLFRCRAHGERRVSYVAMIGALYWLLPAIGLVVHFGWR